MSAMRSSPPEITALSRRFCRVAQEPSQMSDATRPLAAVSEERLRTALCYGSYLSARVMSLGGHAFQQQASLQLSFRNYRPTSSETM